jgi:hypothetical protein
VIREQSGRIDRELTPTLVEPVNAEGYVAQTSDIPDRSSGRRPAIEQSNMDSHRLCGIFQPRNHVELRIPP